MGGRQISKHLRLSSSLKRDLDTDKTVSIKFAPEQYGQQVKTVLRHSR